MAVRAYGATAGDQPLAPMDIDRRVADIEMIAIGDIEIAFDRMQRSEVKYRFVIDSATLAA